MAPLARRMRRLTMLDGSESMDRLVADARPRKLRRIAAGELLGQTLVALLFVAAALALLSTGTGGREIDPLDVLLLGAAAVVLGRFDFEVGAGYTVPTQIVFVPMLFVLPPAIVPLVVAGSMVLDRLPEVVRGDRHPQRLLFVLGDAWFSIGPAAVFVLASVDGVSLADWPIYTVALGAQFATDLAAAAASERLALDVPARVQLRAMATIWLVDALLAPIGLLAAVAAAHEPYAYLLVLPLAALFSVFARERRARIDKAIELSRAYRNTALVLGDVIGDHDEYTGSHSRGVVALSLAIADELRVDEESLRLVELGALLHDVGKLSVPRSIINKPGKLNDEEWAVIKRHTIIGQQMLDRVGGALHDVGLVVRSSHERYDGNGYPDRLSAEEIPLPSRIVCVADAFSAMTTDRAYRCAMSTGVAVDELRSNAGTQFDPRVVEATRAVIERREPEESPAPAPALSPALVLPGGARRHASV